MMKSILCSLALMGPDGHGLRARYGTEENRK